MVSDGGFTHVLIATRPLGICSGFRWRMDKAEAARKNPIVKFLLELPLGFVILLHGRVV